MFAPFLSMLTAACVVALLFAEWREHRMWGLATKSAASLCFVLLGAVLAARAPSAFDRFIVVGLCLAAVGDVCLALPGQRAFQSGVVAFLAGHLAYVAAAHAALASRPLSPSGLSIVVPSALAYAWLYPHLGSLRIPVTIYVIVISVMVAYAFGVRSALPSAGERFFWGALLFYVSDLSVARDRFVKSSLVNRLWGLPAYYAGQLLIAWSITDL